MDSEPGTLSITFSQYRDWLSNPVHDLASAIEEASKQSQIRPLERRKDAWSIACMTRGAIQRRLLGHSDNLAAVDSESLLGFMWASLAV